MCYNCGCGMPNNDMGSPKNITTKSFEEAAKVMGNSEEQGRQNAKELLEKVLKVPPDQRSPDKNWKP